MQSGVAYLGGYSLSAGAVRRNGYIIANPRIASARRTSSERFFLHRSCAFSLAGRSLFMSAAMS
eukprot:scaffold5169_cov366-Prasinococcus_capsulatus_cf.AAC.6